MSAPRILNHPDREEIIKQLSEGISVQKVSKWLAEKHPDSKELQVDYGSLASFRKQYLNIDREAALFIRREKQLKEAGLQSPNPNGATFIEHANEDLEKYQLRVRETLLAASPTYRDKLKDITDAQLDAPRLIKELHTLLQSRIEVYYNEIATAKTVGDTLKADKMFLDYVKLATDVLRDSKKVWDDYNSQPDEGVVDLNVVHRMIGAVRETVKDLLGEFAPELALEFIDKMNKRLSDMEYQMPQIKEGAQERKDRITKKIKQVGPQSEANGE